MKASKFVKNTTLNRSLRIGLACAVSLLSYSAGAEGFDYNQSFGNADTAASQQSGKPNSQWEMYQQLEQMQRELSSLRGIVERQATTIERMRKEQKQRYNDVDSRLTSLKEAAKASGLAISDAAVKAGDDTVAETIVADAAQPTLDANLSSKQLYGKAITAIKTKRFPEAISILNTIKQRFPKDGYAPNIEYWLGELHLTSAPPDYETAKKHFITLLTQHKGHPKVADGMYKLGVVFYEQKEKEKAIVTLKKVLVEYPKTDAAKLAVKLLKTYGAG